MVGDYTKTDFDALKYPIHRLEDGQTVLARYPVLRSFPEFRQELDLPKGISYDQVVRYIIYHYDPNSPLRREDTVEKLKVYAAIMAGFKETNGRFSDDVIMIMKSQVPEVCRMAIRYLRFTSSMDMSLLRAGQDALYNNILLMDYDTSAQAADPIKYAGSKMDLFNKCKTLMTELKKQATDIAAGDVRLLNDLDLVYQDEDSGILGASLAERWAKKRKKDEQPVD